MFFKPFLSSVLTHYWRRILILIQDTSQKSAKTRLDLMQLDYRTASKTIGAHWQTLLCMKVRSHRCVALRRLAACGKTTQHAARGRTATHPTWTNLKVACGKDFRHEHETKRYFFTSARIVGRAIEYVPSRVIDAFPRRRLGALSIAVALASILAVSPSFIVSSHRPSHARRAVSRHSSPVHQFLPRSPSPARQYRTSPAPNHPPAGALPSSSAISAAPQERISLRRKINLSVSVLWFIGVRSTVYTTHKRFGF